MNLRADLLVLALMVTIWKSFLGPSPGKPLVESNTRQGPTWLEPKRTEWQRIDNSGKPRFCSLGPGQKQNTAWAYHAYPPRDVPGEFQAENRHLINLVVPG